MKTVFLLQHQHGGKLTDHVFAELPTTSQMEAVGVAADAVFRPGWIRPVEVAFVEDDTVPQFAEQGVDTGERYEPGTGGGRMDIIGNGVGGVVNPPGFEE